MDNTANLVLCAKNDVAFYRNGFRIVLTPGEPSRHRALRWIQALSTLILRLNDEREYTTAEILQAAIALDSFFREEVKL